VEHNWSQENCRHGPDVPVKPAAPARVDTGVAILLVSLALLVLPSTVVGQTTLRDAIASGRPIVDVRLRFEHVDQSDKPKDAVATTIRARLGYQTGQFHGFTGLAEFDVVEHLGPRRFHDSINGSADYPTIPDPDMTVLNRLQLSYSARLTDLSDDPDLRVTFGRQRIVFGDARFVGNAAWRQHEQTFDALFVSNTSLPATTLSYAYVARVNRMFGPDNPVGVFDSHSHLLNAVYAGFLPMLRVESYAYLLDLEQAPTLSTATYGLRGESSFQLGSGLTARLNGAFAHQEDRAENPLSVSLWYDLVEAGLGYGEFSAFIGREAFEGNGEIGFQTPLASPHAFQGWAEVFVTKPPDGLIDMYAKASYGLPLIPVIGKVTASVAYHEFSAERTSADLGNEWDGSVEARLNDRFSYGTALALYEGGGARPSKHVFWLYATYVF
jgi:hypothetical protein